MLNDVSAMNPKGHVKVELYNDKGVFYTKERKNLVVQSANEIIANMMADPAKLVRIHQVDKGEALVANGEGLYPLALSVQHEKEVVFENDYGETNNTTSFTIEELKGITNLLEVKVGETVLVIDKDVKLKDAELGVIEFAEAPKEVVTIKFRKINNPYMKMIEGTEVVRVDGVEFQRADVANSDTNHYAIDAKAGIIYFSKPAEKVEVEYDYHMHYSLGFMGIGGKPTGHPEFQPVNFSNSNKLDVDMENEFKGARMPIQYPASITPGAVELDPPIMTKPVNTVLMPEHEITVAEDLINPGNAELVYELPNVHDKFGRTLHEIVSVKNATKETEIDIENVEIVENTSEKVEIKLRAEDVEIGDVIKVRYRLKLNDLHLIYQLSQAPVVKLIQVTHTAANGDGIPKTYHIVGNGLKPNEGDVWIQNPNTGTIQFAKGEPIGDAPPVDTPGQIEVTYQVNSGTVVKFVADFPKGVPAPTIEDDEEQFTIVAGQTNVSLQKHEIAKDEETGTFFKPMITVTQGGNAPVELGEDEYEISTDGRTISFPTLSLAAGDIVHISYKFEKTTHDIYQVAMFDQKDGGKMFNISGIGPITKDKNTGMRVSWSVTF